MEDEELDEDFIEEVPIEELTDEDWENINEYYTTSDSDLDFY